MSKSAFGKCSAALAVSALALSVSSAFAAGFQLTEQSSLGLGRAYAGAGIVGDDLSAVHYNPAGMTLLPGTQMQAGFVHIDLNAEYEGTDPATGKPVSENGRYKGQAIPAGYFTKQINDQTWFGLGMTVPYGMGTEYDAEWSGNARGVESYILTVDINPNIAYKVNDKWSIGGGLSLQYAKAKLAKGNAGMGNGEITADSWDWGWNLGVMFTPTEKLRFGLSYRSAIEHNAEGDFEWKASSTAKGMSAQILGAGYKPGMGNATYDTILGLTSMDGKSFDSKATVKTPDTFMLTGTWEATDALRISGLIRYAKWSNFKQLVIENEGFPGSTVENNWEDTWLFSIGADYKLNSEWTVRAGLAYETDPIKDESTRTAVIPDTDRVWMSLGASYNCGKNLQADFGFAYLMGVGNTDLYTDVGGQKMGEYKSLDAYLIGAQVQYRF